jgi:hypothetical protein
MSDLMIISRGLPAEADDVARLLGAPDLTASQQLETRRVDDFLLGVTSRKDAPLPGPRIHQQNGWSVIFAGDLVDREAVPFDAIIQSLSAGDFASFVALEGIYALAAYNDSTKTLYAVSDRRAQKPLFYLVDSAGVRLATSLACLARLPEERTFDKEWLWQLLYFNIPVDDATFIQGVKRLPPATVLTVNCRSHEQTMDVYAEPFRAQNPLLKGKESLELTANVFGARVRSHYQGADDVACALTNGWDGRTLLAMAPDDKKVTAYTYGKQGCDDLQGAMATAKAINVNHRVIPFDESFVRDLPRHALETVYLSGGLQGVLRATLHHAYDVLTDGGTCFPLTISGISLGTQLRGAAQYPDLISMELAMRFQGMRPAADELHRDALPGSDQPAFDKLIDSRLKLLTDRFGPFESGEHHLAYTVYPASAHYFCGELAVADRYTTVRVPAWDSKLIELNFGTEHSTMSFSHFARRSRKVKRKEMEMQAHLIKTFSPAVYRLPVRGIHPAVVLAGEIPYQAERAYRLLERQVSSRLFSHRTAPLENWNAWLFDDNLEFVKSLLQSSETLIGEFVQLPVVDRTIQTRNIRLLGKLMTTEIILRLIKSGWQKFW